MSHLAISIIAFLAAGIAWCICSQADWLAQRLKLMDIPDPIGGRKRHNQATPLLGGTAALLPTFAILAFGTLLGNLPNRQIQSDILLITLTAVSLYLIGLLDDRNGLSARFRLAVSITTTCIAVMATPNLQLTVLVFHSIQTPLILGAAAVPLSIICWVGLVNAVNMADGKNGLVSACCCVWTALLLYYAPAYLRPAIGALLGALIVVFLFNVRGKLFLGDGGSYGLAALIGGLTMYIYALRFDVLSADQIMLWFLIPVVDCLRLLVFRTARGVSPFAPDRTHFHHYLAARWNWHWGRYIYWGLVIIPNIAAIFWPEITPFLLLAVLGVYTALIKIAAPALARDLHAKTMHAQA